MRGVQVSIVGAADTEVGVLPGKSPTELCVEAALLALADAGLDKADVDGLITCNSFAEPIMYHAEAIAESLGPYLAYRFRADRLSLELINRVETTIPNRVLYFDCMDFSIEPLSVPR